MKTMRRALVTLLSLGLIAGALAAPVEAKKKPKKPKRVERTQEVAYDNPAIGHPDVAVACVGANGCAQFAMGAEERYVMLVANDATGLPTYMSAGQDLDGDQFVDNSVGVCGSTTEPLLFEPGFQLTVFISAFPGAMPPCAGAGTTGTVTATISNLP